MLPTAVAPAADAPVPPFATLLPAIVSEPVNNVAVPPPVVGPTMAAELNVRCIAQLVLHWEYRVGIDVAPVGVERHAAQPGRADDARAGKRARRYSNYRATYALA